MTKPLDQMTPLGVYEAVRAEWLINRASLRWPSFTVELGPLWAAVAFGSVYTIPIYRPRPEWSK